MRSFSSRALPRGARSATRVRTRFYLAGLAAGTLLIGGCGAYPKDAAGSFEQAEGGTLVVGVSPHEPWTSVAPATGDVSGSEVELVRGFADEIGADVDWRVGAESELAEWLDGGDIDVVIGGFQANSPWTEEIAFTRPYEEVEADGVTRKMVMGVRRGENRMLVELERYLSRATGEI